MMKEGWDKWRAIALFISVLMIWESLFSAILDHHLYVIGALGLLAGILGLVYTILTPAKGR
jgi:hypothetical protein